MKTTETTRYAWKKHLNELAAKGDYEGVLRGMAQNYGHKGDINAMIEDFCENADPWEA